MKRCLKSYLAIIIGLTIINGCEESKTLPSKQWLKGNLHTHSYWSDGDEFPEVIMDWYKSNDYQFVALTDHNILAKGEKWKTISEDSIYQKAFKAYLDKYGDEWVEYKVDGDGKTQVKLKTYNEYKSLFEEKGKFLILQSEEISDNYDNKPLHLNATNIQKKIDPQGGESVVEVLQNNIDAVNRHSKETNIPMLTVINHPNFYYAIGLEDMVALEDERFFELYNGHHMVNNLGDSTHMSTERMWDLINIAYIENDKPIMYGLATDDSHNYHVKGKNFSNAGRGWIQVRADSIKAESIIRAMNEGDFYASTGVELEEIKAKNNHYSVSIKAEENVSYQVQFIGCKKGGDKPEILQSEKSNEASFTLTEDILYVRCKIISSKLQENPVESFVYEMAWTQPLLYQAK